MWRSYFYLNPCFVVFLFFFFNDTATTEIYTLSLHDALPISARHEILFLGCGSLAPEAGTGGPRSEEHTSELQSLAYLVCRLLLEKKKQLSTYVEPVRKYDRVRTRSRSNVFGIVLSVCTPRQR